MPELPVKEVRPAELHLPEIKRDQIVSFLSEIRLPAIARPNIERPRLQRPSVERPDLGTRINWRALDPSAIDFGRAVAGIAAVARVGRPVIRRSRGTFAVGALVVFGIVAVTLLATPAVRERAGRSVRGVRARVDSRGRAPDMLEVEEDIATATTATDPAQVEIAPSMNGAAADSTGSTLGSMDSIDSSVLEEIARPA